MATIVGSRFHQPAKFRSAYAKGDFEIRRTSFYGDANFERIEVAKSAFFRPDPPDNEGNPVRFGGEARFLGAHIKGQAVFDQAEFAESASLCPSSAAR